MKKTLILIITFITGLCSIIAQPLELNDKLMLDQSVITGVLDNGLKYYIKENNHPEGRIELSLAVKAGSILEDEDQLGLAHFVEHMAFNGTKNFPKNDLIYYLESLGMRFGADINAYTSFDETVYGIQIPADSADFVDKGLLVLSDWAHQVTFDPQDIEEERGIIYEEWRFGQGAMDRIQREYLPKIFYNSLYADRLPIGDMDIVMNCPPEALVRFYEDWYRPDLMAVIAVGDFDGKEMEQKIINQFSKIPAKENPRERITPDIPDHKETLVSVATDPEAPISLVQMVYKHPVKQIVTVEDYREHMIASLFNSMISERLQELTLQENPPFAQAFAAYTNFIGPKAVYMTVGVVQDNDIERTLIALTEENQRVSQHGLVQEEMETQKASLMRSAQRAYNERNTKRTDRFLGEYQRHFLYPHIPYLDAEYRLALYEKYLETITLEEVNAFAQSLVTDENAVIIVVAPEDENIKIPGKDEVLRIYNTTNAKTLDPYVYEISDDPLISSLPERGKRTNRERNRDLGYEVWSFGNGINVVIKNTDFSDDQILFEARSFGGYSLYNDEDDVSSRIAARIANESGLGSFNKIELQRKLAGTDVSLTPYIGKTTQGLRGSSSPDDFETLLKLIHLSFAQPRLTETAFNSWIAREKGILENSERDPRTIWQNEMRKISGNYHHRNRPLTADLLDEADFRRTRYIFNHRFGAPGNFTFYFVGNIEANRATRKLMEQYIGSLPLVERNETFRELGINPPKGVVKETVKRGTDDHCWVGINFHGDLKYNALNKLELDAISSILSTKLLKEIREKESGVYTIGAYPSTSRYPKPSYNIIIFFTTDPQRKEELTEKIFEIIAELKNGGITEEEIRTEIEKQRRGFETNLRENSYWRNLLISLREDAISQEEFEQYKSMIRGINIEAMQSAAQRFFDDENYYQVVLLREDMD